jgi:hypothetical protein
MPLYYEPPATWFAHIPKTGGISLGTLIEAAYKPSDVLRLEPPSLAKIAVSELSRFRCFHDFHHGRAMLNLTGRTDLVCITMLREPVERSVSQILYFQRTVAEIPHTFTPEYLQATQPILQFDLSTPIDPTIFELVCDTQWSMLGVMRDYRPLFKGSPDAASGRSVIRPFPVPLLTDLSDMKSVLDNARRWLSEMAIVGVNEHFNESVLLVCDVLGIPAPTSLPRANRNPQRTNLKERYRSTLAPRVAEQLAELTQHDQELYSIAYERFQQQWAQYQAHPRRTYSIAPRLRALRPKAAKLKRQLISRVRGPKISQV